MKKYLIIFLLLFIPINVFSLVEKSQYEYVTDSSGVLSDETINFIYDSSNYLDKIDDIDYYVVTVKSLDDYTIEDYADKVYKNFNISEKGILILLSTDDRRLRVKVGEDLADIIYPQLIDEYIDEYFMTYFKNGEWDSGIKNGYSAFYKLICNYYDIDTSDVNVYKDNIIGKYKNYILFLIIWFITLIGYIFSEYFFRLFLNKTEKKQSIMDTILFGICLFISMLLLNLTYLIMPKALIIVLGFEMIAIISNVINHTRNNDFNSKKKKKKKKVIKKKKKITK